MGEISFGGGTGIGVGIAVKVAVARGTPLICVKVAVDVGNSVAVCVGRAVGEFIFCVGGGVAVFVAGRGVAVMMTVMGGSVNVRVGVANNIAAKFMPLPELS